MPKRLRKAALFPQVLPIFARRAADAFLERPRIVIEVQHPDVGGNLLDLHVRGAQKPQGFVDAQVGHVVGDGRVHFLLEDSGEVGRADVEIVGQRGQGQGAA